ncbi:MAG: prolyl oligopeptidase family serine peptidase [Acidobacteriota bacterium]
MTRALILLLISFGVLLGQDAELVLRTTVGYSTMLASRKMSDEVKAEAQKLGQAARVAAANGRYGEAMQSYAQGTALMLGQEWTPAAEFTAGLRAKANHAIVAPGALVRITLDTMFAATRPLAEKVAVTLTLRRPNEVAGPPIAAATLVGPDRLPLTIEARIPQEAAGDYLVDARLSLSEKSLPGRTIPVHVEDLADDVAALRKRNPVDPTPAYALELFDRADRGEISPFRIDFKKEFARAHTLLDTPHPFAGVKGDMRRAYRSPVDQTLQPYRLFVPASYDGEKPAGLGVALHGMGGDENSIFDQYAAGRMKAEADKRGLFVVCPKGRGPASMYRGAAEQDVLDVLAEVQREYKIDPQRVYLMGHSMGAYGAWSIAMNHPERFAALGPIAGGGNPAGLEKIKAIPHYLVHGDNDKTVPVAQSRMMVEAAKKLGTPHVYVEVPNGSHTDIAVPHFAPMLDYFLQAR